MAMARQWPGTGLSQGTALEAAPYPASPTHLHVLVKHLAGATPAEEDSSGDRRGGLASCTHHAHTQQACAISLPRHHHLPCEFAPKSLLGQNFLDSPPSCPQLSPPPPSPPSLTMLCRSPLVQLALAPCVACPQTLSASGPLARLQPPVLPPLPSSGGGYCYRCRRCCSGGRSAVSRPLHDAQTGMPRAAGAAGPLPAGWSRSQSHLRACYGQPRVSSRNPMRARLVISNAGDVRSAAR